MAGSGSARTIGGVVLALQIGACSLFVDTDGLTGGDSGIADDAGGADATDATFADVASEASADAGDAAPLQRYCQAHSGHTLCLDFDDSNDVPHIGGSSYDSAKLFVDDATSASAPRSLSVFFPSGGSSEEIDEAFTSSATLSGSIDLRFDASDLTTGQIIPLEIDYGPTPGVADHFYYLQTYYGFLNFSEALKPDDGGAPFYTSNTIASPVPTGKWVHVDYAVAADGHISVSLDGAPVIDTPGQIALTAGVGVSVSIGAYSNDLGADVTEHLDDVVVDP